MRITMLLHKSVEFDSRVRREASALTRAGHDVIVLELAPVPSDSSLSDGFRRRSVLPPAGVERWMPFHLYRIAFVTFFVRGILASRPDVVHAHDAAMLVPGLLGARLIGARLVYDSHELAASVPYRERAWARFVAGIERLALPRCAAVITVSDGIARRLELSYRLGTRPTVVRNVSALERHGVGGLRASLRLSDREPLILHQGAPAPGRGCEVLIDAVTMVPEARLVFLGDPEPGYERNLRARIESRGLRERVVLLPSIPLSDLLAHTSEADVGVTLLQDTCENHRLALPNKLFEYVAAGIPVLASALPEVERLVKSYGIGWCVTPDDPAAVADGIRQALAHRDDDELRERVSRAAAELRWPVEQQRLIELYGRL
jgi:glycosyltransferase involved in cell wall biosynthesis